MMRDLVPDSSKYLGIFDTLSNIHFEVIRPGAGVSHSGSLAGVKGSIQILGDDASLWWFSNQVRVKSASWKTRSLLA